MNKSSSDFLAFLDRQIAKKSAELKEAERMIHRMASLTNDLHSLKRTREIVSGETSSQNPETVPLAQGELLPTGTLGDYVVQVLIAAPSPMDVPSIERSIRAKGKDNFDRNSLHAILSKYLKRGKVARPQQGLYTMPHHGNGQVAAGA